MTGKLKVGYPRITLAHDANQRINAFTKIASGEYSLMGEVEERTDTTGKVTGLHISRVHFIEQVNTKANTELDDEGLAKLVVAMENEEEDSTMRLRAWIHSHGTQATFWSPTDMDTIRKLLTSSEGYLVSIVVNKAGDVRCRLDTYAPIPFSVDEITPEVDAATNPLYAECEAIYKKMAKEIEIVGHHGTVGGSRAGHHNSGYMGGGYYNHEGYEGHKRWVPGDEAAEVAKKNSAPSTKDTSGKKKPKVNGTTGGTGGQPKEDTTFDSHSPVDVVKQFPQIDEADALILATGWHFHLVDDQEYDLALQGLVEGKELDDLLDHEKYAELEALYVSTLGSEDDVMSRIDRDLQRTCDDPVPDSIIVGDTADIECPPQGEETAVVVAGPDVTGGLPPVETTNPLGNE